MKIDFPLKKKKKIGSCILENRENSVLSSILQWAGFRREKTQQNNHKQPKPTNQDYLKVNYGADFPPIPLHSPMNAAPDH